MDNRDWGAPREPSPADFISQHPVFRIEEAEAWYRELHRGGLEQARRAIRYHLSTGRLRRLRRDVYVERTCIDPWLVASRLATDVIIAFDGALPLHGLAGNPYNLTYVTQQRGAAICFHDTILQPVRLARDAAWRSFHFDSVTGPDYFLRTARGPDDSIIAKWNLIVSPEQRTLYEAARNT